MSALQLSTCLGNPAMCCRSCRAVEAGRPGFRWPLRCFCLAKNRNTHPKLYKPNLNLNPTWLSLDKLVIVVIMSQCMQWGNIGRNVSTWLSQQATWLTLCIFPILLVIVTIVIIIIVTIIIIVIYYPLCTQSY